MLIFHLIHEVVGALLHSQCFNYILIWMIRFDVEVILDPWEPGCFCRADFQIIWYLCNIYGHCVDQLRSTQGIEAVLSLHGIIRTVRRYFLELMLWGPVPSNLLP